jgi:hypothetical protein
MHKAVGDQTLFRDSDSVNPATGYRAYFALFTWAQLALKLFGFIHYPIPGHVMDGDRTSLKQVWPDMKYDIVWPPFPAAGDRNLKGLIEFLPLSPE